MPGGQRREFACESDGERWVFVAGGIDAEGNIMRSAIAYDVVEDRWAPMPDMAHTRESAKGGFSGGTFHVIGGFSTTLPLAYDRSAECFDVASWKWGPVEENVLPRASLAQWFAVTGDGRTYLSCPRQLHVRDGHAWPIVSKLPSYTPVDQFLTAWEGGLLISGLTKERGPLEVYTTALEKDDNELVWRAEQVPKDYVGPLR